MSDKEHGRGTATINEFRHSALFYRGEDEFVTETGAFVRDGLEADEAVLVAVPVQRAERLREQLADDARRIRFVDMEQIGRNPARIIPVWRAFADEHATVGRGFRGIGEPIWDGRNEQEVVECQLHEALLNLAFDGGAAWSLLCPYDASVLDPDVIARARHSHRLVCEHGAMLESDLFEPLDPDAAFSGGLEDPPPELVELAFTADDLGAIREVVGSAAIDAGARLERAADLVLAASELAANSIRHGGGRGTLRVWKDNGSVICECRDAGGIDQPLVGRVRPRPDQVDGRGLWLANEVCDLVQIRSLRDGSVVRVHLRVD